MSERAAQFSSFSPLKGYYNMLKEREKIITPKRELSEDWAEELSQKIRSVKVGDMVTVEHYCEDGYIKTEGVISKLDFGQKLIWIVKTEIQFDDIWDIVRGEKE